MYLKWIEAFSGKTEGKNKTLEWRRFQWELKNIILEIEIHSMESIQE